MSAGYTPGPWKAVHDLKCTNGELASGVVSESTGCTVAWAHGPNDAEMIANARQLSASLQLMEACEFGDIRLMHGDCLDLLPNIPDQSIDLVLADLPYGTTRNKWDSVIPLEPLWAEYLRVCKGAIVLTAQTPFDKVLGASNLPMLRYEWIWEKSNPTGHLNAKKAPMKAHENVLVFYRKQPTYNFIKTGGHVRKSAVRRHCDSPNYGRQESDPITYDSTERYPRSVLKFASDKQKSNLHPTQKPVALMEYLVRTYSNPGDLVLDNCFGSATTAIACLRTGRKHIGMEKDPAYFEVGVTRAAAAIGEGKNTQHTGEQHG